MKNWANEHIKKIDKQLPFTGVLKDDEIIQTLNPSGELEVDDSDDDVDDKLDPRITKWQAIKYARKLEICYLYNLFKISWKIIHFTKVHRGILWLKDWFPLEMLYKLDEKNNKKFKENATLHANEIY